MQIFESHQRKKSVISTSFSFVLFFLSFQVQAITYYSYTNGGSTGNWNDPQTWTTDPSGGSLTGSAIPTDNDAVVILNGYTVHLSANIVASGLSITIQSGGTLDLHNFVFNESIGNLNGTGALRIGSGYFPDIISNSFVTNSSALVEFYDFTGSLPIDINYPNLVFSNSTTTNHTITFSNTSSYSFAIQGNFTTLATNTGNLSVNFGSQGGNTINSTLYGSMNIGAGTRLGVGVYNSSHRMTLMRNLTNNGTIDFSNNNRYASGTNGVMNLIFSGATNNTLNCNGITDLNTLTVDKGTGSDNILHVTASDPDYFKLFSNGQLIFLEAGTLRLSTNIIMTRINGGENFNLGSTTQSPMLWIDGAIVDANSAALVVYGKFRITAGSFTSIGREGGVIREEGQYIIEGGTVTLEKFRPSNTASTHRGSFIMTGGTFNAIGTASNDDYARFSHPYPEQVFIMSGGTINVSNPESSGPGRNGGIHIGVKSSNFAVTGGTFNAILSGPATSYSISSTAPFYNLNISRTGGTPTTVNLEGIGSLSGSVTTAQPLTVLNNFTIDGVNNPVFNPHSLDVSLHGNFTINDGASYLAGANNTIFSGSGDQVYTNSASISSGMKQMTVAKPAGTLTLAGTTPSFEVTHLLALSSGILNDGGKTINVLGEISNEAIHSGTGSITLKGTATQTLSGDGNGIFGNVTLDNTSNPGAIFTSNHTVSGTLTLAGTGNSILDIDIYQLSLTSTSSGALTTTGDGFSASKMIRTSGRQSDGGIRKNFGNLSPFVFACGTPSAYAPVTIQFNATPASYGNITIRPVDSRHQFVNEGNTNNLQLYWKVTSSGVSGIPANGISHTYQYTDALVNPTGDDVNYIPARYHSTSWNVINNTNRVNEGSNQIFFTNVNYVDGDYTAGVFPAFGTVTVFYSKRSGDWNNISAGTTPWSTVSHTGPDASAVPGPNDQVFIGDGAGNNHTVSVTTNGQNAGSLVISQGSVLDVTTTTGHNFGALPNAQVMGNGKLKISSALPVAEFPAGDFGNFIRASGGIVEYYSTGTQDFTIPETSASPSFLPLITYKHLEVAPASGRRISMPNQDETIYGNLTIRGQSSTALAQLNASSAKNLVINGNLSVNSGTLEYQNNTPQSVSVEGDISVAAGGSFITSGTGGSVANELIIAGNLVNDGVFDMAFNSSLFCDVTFTGSQDASITGSGSVTDFNTLIVSKGNSTTPILDVNAASFSLSGNAVPLLLNTGTFRLSSSQTVNISNNQDFVIPSKARLSANGGTFQLSGSDGRDLLLNGTLEVLDGAVYIGTSANDNSIEYASTGRPTISVTGGNLYVQSQIRRPTSSAQGALSYIQSGSSSVYVGISRAPSTSRGVFEILNSGSSFTMSGGTLSLSKSNNSSAIADLYLYPSSHNVTGGTLEIGTNIGAQTLDISTLVPLFNLTVTGASNTARLNNNPLTLKGSLNISESCVFNANSLDVRIAGNFLNANTNASNGVTVGGYRPGSTTQTTTFNGSNGHQDIEGVSGNMTNFAHLVINNTFADGQIALQANSSIRINNTLTLSNGTLSDGGNTITAIGSVYNAATHSSSGSGQLLLEGSGTQLLSGNGNGKFGNLTLNNSSGAQFNADHEITGNLTFNNGALRIRNYHLYLSNTSLNAIIGANSSNYIISSGQNSDGGITKSFAGSVVNGNFTYPIGVAGKYTPANYTISTGTTGGNINIVPVNAKHASATGPGTSYLNYYWNVTSNVTDLTAISHVYTYSPADVMGTEADYRDARYIGGTWEVGALPGNPDITLNTIAFTNTDLTGGYTTGEPSAFVNSIIYNTIASGSWEADLAVWDVDPPGSNLGPPPGSIVIINEGHTITTNTNAKNIASLEVRGSLHLGTTTGHNFGTVTAPGSGNKTIQLQSSTFPGGNFTAFVAAGGGSIEYNGTVNLPVQATYNHLVFTGAGTKTLANVDLSLNGNLTIEEGTVDNTANNRNISLINDTADFINNGTFEAGSGSLSVGRNIINSGAGAVLNAGSGTGGIRVAGDLTNSAGAVFTMGTDSLVVGGHFNNEASFTGNTGGIRIAGDLNNLGGSIKNDAGGILIGGNFVNNSVFTNASGTITTSSDFSNSGSSAFFSNGSGTLTIHRNFDNSSDAEFQANDGTINIAGDWTNNATFTPNTSLVNYANSTAKVLSGNTTFFNFIKSAGGPLVLSSNVIISNFLFLNNGKIITGSRLLRLTNTSTQPVTGHSANNFIDGRLVISFPNAAGASRLLPIGSGNIYRPVNILQNSSSSDAIVGIEMLNTPPMGMLESTLSEISDTRFYRIDLLSGTINDPVVELNFNTNAPTDEPVATPGNLRVARSTKPIGPWSDEGGAGVFSPAAPAGYVTSAATTLQSPTYFALAYTEDLPLPITLLSFAGELIENAVHLQWATAMEEGNDYFTVERSKDGESFDSLFTIDGSGDSDMIKDYHAEDLEPLVGLSYYRLKQTDFNGAFSYSKIINIINEGEVQFTIFPNPSKGEEINLRIEGAKMGQQFNISLFDLRGNRILGKALQSSGYFQNVILTPKRSLAEGFYILTMQSNSQTITKKILVEN